ncbi:hypothetical protein BKA62DRAFT_718321 [Auriculariales sp. MPI-PUGE-AT-0066]|nr:hypothetical protein BKA62DRAFT_718321 [Auriculariales sp. MPI-PUGE-AT-0066]
MKLSALFVLAAPLVASVSARLLNHTSLDDELKSDISKRACVPTKCKCYGMFAASASSTEDPKYLMCGDGAFGCENNSVFQCNSRDPGVSCSYGPRDACVKCNALFC